MAAPLAPCSVCKVPDGPCIGVDQLPLPSFHEERTATTPLFDELLAGAR